MDCDFEALSRRFTAAADEFAVSALYRQLCLTVAADGRLLRIAADRRTGQQPANLLLAAVHYLLLNEPEHELARWYVSIDGARARPPETAGPAFTDFCLRERERLVSLIRERLVQTHVVKRAAALRFGLAHVARRTDQPVTLIEIGASAGVLLAFDRYRYRLGERTFGPPDSPVEIETEWRGAVSELPDVDRLPAIARRFGIDLSPIDPRDPIGRRWLRALVWPGNEGEWELLERALDLIADDPPPVIGGDAIEILRGLGQSELAPDAPVVVFHAATRAHVPAEGRDAFDQAIRDLGRDRRLFWLSLEGTPHPLTERAGTMGAIHLLQLVEIDGDREETWRLAAVEQHGEWLMPLPAG